VASADGGNLSATSSWKTDIDSMTVMTRDTFSPESTGRKYPRIANIVIITDGKMILMT
jgi:Ni2+-binding GTPase involved in maturation of urease and hydrogenase